MSRRASMLRAPRSPAARRYPSSEAARDQDDLVLFTEGAANLFAAPDLGRASAIGGSGRPEPARPMSQLGRTQPAAADPTEVRFRRNLAVRHGLAKVGNPHLMQSFAWVTPSSNASTRCLSPIASYATPRSSAAKTSSLARIAASAAGSTPIWPGPNCALSKAHAWRRHHSGLS